MWAKRIGFGLLLGGLLLFVAGLTLVRWHTWTPVRTALPLNTGAHVELPFKSDFSASQRILLTVKPGADWKRTECLVGASPPELCRLTPAIVDVSWQVLSGKVLVAAGDSHKWLGGSGLGRILVGFETKRTVAYVLRLNVNRDASELNALSPEITVETDNLLLEEYIILAGLLQLAGVAVIAIGLVLLVWALLSSPAKSKIPIVPS